MEIDGFFIKIINRKSGVVVIMKKIGGEEGRRVGIGEKDGNGWNKGTGREMEVFGSNVEYVRMERGISW